MSQLRCFVRVHARNRHSMAAVMAVLQAELEPELLSLHLAASPEQIKPPALVLYSFMTRDVPQVAQEVSLLRRTFGHSLLLVAGGPHPSGDPEGTLGLGFDAAYVGEAGPELGGLVRAMVQHTFVAPSVVRAAALENLDRYSPWPHTGELFVPVELMRGCPMSCAYCQTPRLFGRKPRYRSLESIRRLWQQSVAAGHRFTRFIAPNAFAYGSRDGRTPNLQALGGLLRTAVDCGMQRTFLGTFPSEVRPESVTDEALELVRRYCANNSIALGLQSGSDAVLSRVRRGHTVQQGVQAVARVAAHGMVPVVDFLFGLPGETDQDRACTRRLIEHLAQEYGARVHLHAFTPLVGTPLANEPAAVLDDATRQLIDRLRGRGQATGADGVRGPAYRPCTVPKAG